MRDVDEADRERRALALFEQALELEGEDRARFLARAREEDPALADVLDALCAADEEAPLEPANLDLGSMEDGVLDAEAFAGLAFGEAGPPKSERTTARTRTRWRARGAIALVLACLCGWIAWRTVRRAEDTPVDVQPSHSERSPRNEGSRAGTADLALAEAWRRQGESAFERRELARAGAAFERARELFSAAAEARPDDPETNLGLGRVLVFLGSAELSAGDERAGAEHVAAGLARLDALRANDLDALEAWAQGHDALAAKAFEDEAWRSALEHDRERVAALERLMREDPDRSGFGLSLEGVRERMAAAERALRGRP